MPLRQRFHPLHESLVPLRLRRRVTLARPRLAQSPTRPTLGDPEASPHVTDGDASPGRAQKFPLATSFRIWLSSACSATIRFSRAFSFSSSRSRFASSAFIPPYWFRQRWNVVSLTPNPRQTSVIVAPEDI